MTRRTLLVPFAVIFFGLALAVFVLGNPATEVQSNAATGLNGALLSAYSSSPAPKSLVELGKTLFVENCSACHGVNAQGSVVAPNLVDLGPATIDLWIRVGWMPLAEPGIQPVNKPSKFTIPETNEIVAYVTSLGPLGPKIPVVNLRKADLSEGFSLFSLNCAACHTITGAGDALASGVHAPPLHGVAAQQIAEAIRTGPGNMPRFGPGTISHQHLVDIVGYVVKEIEHPDSPGGLGLGGVGPVAEGFVGLFVGVGGAMLIAFWIGDRTEIDEERPYGGGHSDEQPEGVAHV